MIALQPTITLGACIFLLSTSPLTCLKSFYVDSNRRRLSKNVQQTRVFSRLKPLNLELFFKENFEGRNFPSFEFGHRIPFCFSERCIYI